MYCRQKTLVKTLNFIKDFKQDETNIGFSKQAN